MSAIVSTRIEEGSPQSPPPEKCKHAEIGDGSPQSPTSATDKRKHAEIGDGSPQSPPPPMEKRDRVENMEQLSESMPPAGALLESLQSPGDQECDGGKGSSNVDEDERIKKIVEKETAFWKKLGVKFPKTGDDDPEAHEQLGEFDGYLMKSLSNFKENHQLYHELMGFAKKVVAYFNDKNNQNLCFDDIVEVASCCCCGNNYWLTIKAIDLVDANPLMILKGEGKIRRGTERRGIEEEVEVEVEDCMLVTLDDLPPLVALALAAR